MITPTSLLTMFVMALAKAVDKLKTLWDDSPVKELIFEDTTTTGEQAYNWLLAFPIVRKFVGTKTYNEMQEKEYKLKVDPFYTGLKIKEEDLRRRKLPNTGKIQESNYRALTRHKQDMVAQALIDGVTELAYDGVPFFANPTGKRGIDNLLAGSGTDVASIQADLKAARLAGRKFYFNEDPSKKPIGLTHNIVVCSPALEDTFLTIMNSTADPSQTNSNKANIAKQYIKKVIVMPQLEDDNDWYLFSTEVIEPFILLKEKLDGKDIRHMMDDTKLKSDHVLLYSAEQNLSTGYTFPQLGIKIVNA